MVKNIIFDHDKEADVLYVTLGKPREAVVEEKGNIGIRIDEKTNEIIGLTIIEFLKIFKQKHAPISISAPKAA